MFAHLDLDLDLSLERERALRLTGDAERPLDLDLSLDTDLLLSLCNVQRDLVHPFHEQPPGLAVYNARLTTGERPGEASRSATGDLDRALGDLDLDLDLAGDTERSLETDLAGEPPPSEPRIGSSSRSDSALAGEPSSSDIQTLLLYDADGAS